MTEDALKYDRIIAECTRTLGDSPSDAVRVKALNNRGLARCDKGEHDLAISDFSEAILCGPPTQSRSTLFYNRGRCRNFTGAYGDAIDDLTEAIRHDPQDAEAYVTRGLAWQSLGDSLKAIADFDLAIQNDRESAIAFHNRGNTWVNLGELRRGIADFTQSLHLDPRDAATHTSRGVAWSRKGRYAKALADYERALKLDPHSAKRRLVLGGFLACCPQRRYRNGARALELMTEACELTDYSDATYLNVLAAAHAEQNDFHSAIAVLHESLSIATQDDDKEDARFCLDLYEKGEPWRLESRRWRQHWA